MDEASLRGLQEHSAPNDRRVHWMYCFPCVDDAIHPALRGGSGLVNETTLQYFEQLKNSSEGWKLCATDFTSRLHSDDHVKFFCLQVLEHHVRTRHAFSSDDDILALRKVLLTWMQPQDQESEKVFIKNKMSQIIALTFIADYPMKVTLDTIAATVAEWPQFFADILHIVQLGHVWTVDLYLRMLMAIDSEVVDRHVIHTQEENIRNVLIKDHMRDHCIPDLVESWLGIMSLFEQVNHGVVCLAMEVIGAYVSWINISLIASDKCMSYLLKYLSVDTLRESAADCLHEVVCKGMDPMTKTELVESLFKVLLSVGVLNTDPSTDVDADFQVKLSKLVNGMGCALVTSWNKLVKGEEEDKCKIVLAAIEAKLPYLHRYLRDEDDGVSEAIIDFAVQYVGTLKHQSNLSDNDRTNLQALLAAIIEKLKYDESYNFSNEGEDEIMFLEYRKQLKILLDNVALLDPDLVLHTCQGVLTSVLNNLEQEPFMNVEVVLRVFYMLGEVITDKKCGASNVTVPTSPWYQMMLTVIQSQVYCYKHTAVLLQYYETIVRYEKFFTVEAQYVLRVLEQFLGEHGLRHQNGNVRSRLSYLFVRFIKATKNQIGPVAEQVLTNLQPLLLMFPGSSPEYAVFLSSNDLFFLYESAGILVAMAQQPPEHRKTLMNAILAPLIERYPILLEQLTRTQEPGQQEKLAQSLYSLLSCASRTSKVFTNHQQMKQSGCLECYTEPLPIFLRGLEVVVQRELLHSGVRQYIHRMIICLGDELLKYVPMAISLMLKDCKSRDLQDFIPLINQLITKYKDRILSMLQEIFLPVCRTIIHCINQPFDPNDMEEQRDRLSLRKSYFLFISSVVTNNLSAVIASQETQNVQQILETIIQGAVAFPDPSVQKICFGILRRLIEAWATDDALPGFMDYSYKHILPACFIAPLESSFDFNDGHSFLALGEIAGLLKSFLDKQGSEMLLYLQSNYLPSLHIPSSVTDEVIRNMQQLERSALKVYLKELFLQLRTLRLTT